MGEELEPVAEDRRRWALILLVMGALIAAVLALGLFGALHWSNAWLAWSVSVVAIIAFVGCLILAHVTTDSDVSRMDELRLAITASFVLTYLVLIGLFVFRSQRLVPATALAAAIKEHAITNVRDLESILS